MSNICNVPQICFNLKCIFIVEKRHFKCGILGLEITMCVDYVSMSRCITQVSYFLPYRP